MPLLGTVGYSAMKGNNPLQIAVQAQTAHVSTNVPAMGKSVA